jgi:hypothetical protein
MDTYELVVTGVTVGVPLLLVAFGAVAWFNDSAFRRGWAATCEVGAGSISVWVRAGGLALAPPVSRRGSV